MSQSREKIFAGFTMALFYQLNDASSELQESCQAAHKCRTIQIGVKERSYIVGALLQQCHILLGETKNLGDDSRRQGCGEVGDKIELPGLGNVIKQVFDVRLHARFPGRHRPAAEEWLDDISHPCVIGGIERDQYPRLKSICEDSETDPAQDAKKTRRGGCRFKTAVFKGRQNILITIKTVSGATSRIDDLQRLTLSKLGILLIE